MKTLFVVCLVTTLGLSIAKSAQQEGNPEAAKIAREGSQAAKDQDWNKAIERLRKAAEIDRKYTQNLAIAYQQRAYSYANDQRFQDALTDLAEAIRINPRDAHAFEQRAAIEMKMIDYEKALADYEAAMQADPNDAATFNNPAWLLATSPNDGLRNGKKAVEYALKEVGYRHIDCAWYVYIFANFGQVLIETFAQGLQK